MRDPPDDFRIAGHAREIVAVVVGEDREHVLIRRARKDARQVDVRALEPIRCVLDPQFFVERGEFGRDVEREIRSQVWPRRKDTRRASLPGMCQLRRVDATDARRG